MMRSDAPNKPLEWSGHPKLLLTFYTPCLPLRGSVSLTRRAREAYAYVTDNA